MILSNITVYSLICEYDAILVVFWEANIDVKADDSLVSLERKMYSVSSIWSCCLSGHDLSQATTNQTLADLRLLSKEVLGT